MKRIALWTGLWVLVLGMPHLVVGQSITGDWKGTLKTERISLRVGLHVQQGDSGYEAKLDILDQAARGLPLTAVTFADSILRFELGAAAYTGRYQPDGKIVGKLVQPGETMPMDLERGVWSINRPQEPVAPFPYTIEDVQYPNAAAQGVTLAGTLTIPDQATPYPAVILITGSGANNRDEEILMHKPFWVIADYLSRHGVAVLRFDDRGVGKSTGNHVMATSADFAADALAGVAYLQTRTDLKISKIGLLGHSEGGVIGPMAAIQSEAIDFLVLLAGTGVRGDKLLAAQSELILRADGVAEEEIQKTRAINEDVYRIILKSKTAGQARGKITQRLQKAAQTDSTLTDAAIQTVVAQINNVWFRFFLKHDPAAVLAQVHCPVLAVNGDKDIQVPAQMNLDAIAAALKTAGNQAVTIHTFPGLNHLFQHCQTCVIGEYAQLEETIAPEVLEMVGNWILEQGR
jgi:pimeloyl-ACP methyl ester carboxylesterase